MIKGETYGYRPVGLHLDPNNWPEFTAWCKENKISASEGIRALVEKHLADIEINANGGLNGSKN